jgi:hypothetical protein
LFFSTGKLKAFTDEFCRISAELASAVSQPKINAAQQESVKNNINYFMQQFVIFINSLKNLQGYGDLAGTQLLLSNPNNVNWIQAIEAHKAKVGVFTQDATGYRAFLESSETHSSVVNMFFLVAEASKRV